MQGEKPEGLREQKRRETRERIVRTSLKLFIDEGYEATTIDALAAAAGISRRNFFRYFKSKDEVLLAWPGAGVAQALKPAMLEEARAGGPLAAAERALLKLVSHYETPESISADRLLRSTEILKSRKDAMFLAMEHAMLEAMTEMWPASDRRGFLRIAAMIAIGVLRLSLQDWRDAEAMHPLAHYLQRNFDLVQPPEGA